MIVFTPLLWSGWCAGVGQEAQILAHPQKHTKQLSISLSFRIRLISLGFLLWSKREKRMPRMLSWTPEQAVGFNKQKKPSLSVWAEQSYNHIKLWLRIRHGYGRRKAIASGTCLIWTWKQIRWPQPWKHWQGQQVRDYDSNSSCSSDSNTTFDLTVMQTIPIHYPYNLHSSHAQALQKFRDSARNNFAISVSDFAITSRLINTIQTQHTKGAKREDLPPISQPFNSLVRMFTESQCS